MRISDGVQTCCSSDLAPRRRCSRPTAAGWRSAWTGSNSRCAATTGRWWPAIRRWAGHRTGRCTRSHRCPVTWPAWPGGRCRSPCRSALGRDRSTSDTCPARVRSYNARMHVASDPALRPELDAGLATLGLAAALAPPLLAYLALLDRWNHPYNPTAIRDPRAMAALHLPDSLAMHHDPKTEAEGKKS